MTHWDTLQRNVTVKGKVTSEPANYILHCCSLSAAMRVASCLYVYSSCSLHPSKGSEYQRDERSLLYSTDMGSTRTALLPFLSSTAFGQLVKILVRWEPGHQSRHTAVVLAMANSLLYTWFIMYWEMYKVGDLKQDAQALLNWSLLILGNRADILYKSYLKTPKLYIWSLKERQAPQLTQGKLCSHLVTRASTVHGLSA